MGVFMCRLPVCAACWELAVGVCSARQSHGTVRAPFCLFHGMAGGCIRAGAPTLHLAALRCGGTCTCASPSAPLAAQPPLPALTLPPAALPLPSCPPPPLSPQIGTKFYKSMLTESQYEGEDYDNFAAWLQGNQPEVAAAE